MNRSRHPDGTQIVLAVAEKDGITSEQLTRPIAEKPEIKADRSGRVPPCGDRKPGGVHVPGDSHRLRIHQPDEEAPRVRRAACASRVQADKTWGELRLSGDVELDGDRIEARG